MPNWKRVVSEQNSKVYKWPPGWDTREKVAEHLECSEDRVSEILAPALKSGEVEKASFPVWDSERQRKVYVVGFRTRPKETNPSTVLKKQPSRRKK